MGVFHAALIAIEKAVKVPLFGCRMCGQCILHSTGLVCPMRCPKNLRNGPCGGVRENGNCEVIPTMKCVWVLAYEGSQRIPGGVEAMNLAQSAVDQRLQGSSSWLRVVREKTGEQARNSRTNRFPDIRCRSCPGMSRRAVSNECCAQAGSQ
jgi:hypothetical protein